MPACAPTPAMRLPNSAKYPALAVQFCERSLITLPTASKLFSVPSRASSPKMLVNFERVSVAPSPSSSSATLIWSAALTNPKTSSFDVLPRRPASSASRFKSSRLVRVSIFLKSSFSSFTSLSARPVNLRTFAISASISAKAFTALRPAITSPVPNAAAPARMLPHLSTKPLMRSTSPEFSSCVSLSSSFTSAICALTRLIASHCLFHSSVPRSMPLSERFSSRSTRCSSFGVALLSRCMTFSTPCVALSICAICLFVWRSSRWKRFSWTLSPAAAALVILSSSSAACFFSCSSIFCACLPFTVSVTVALVLMSDIVFWFWG